MTPFDLIVIGSGSAGLSAVEAAKEAGAKTVAIVESAKRLGGECPNWGCVPTKAILRSMEVLLAARRGAIFGLRIPSINIDFPLMMRRKEQIVDQLTGHKRIEKIITQLGATLIRGEACFVNKNEIEVAGHRYSAKRFVIATGSETFVPPIPGLKEAGFSTSEDTVKLKKIPASCVIVGGGPIGVEVAQMLAPLGTKVVIVEFMDHLLPREDEEIAAVVKDSFIKQKIHILTGTKTMAVKKAGKEFIVSVAPAQGGKEKHLKTNLIIIATGKRPLVSHLGLEKVGVKLNERGMPILNPYLQTTNPAVYVAGDASGQMLFTHVAHMQGEVAGTNAITGNKKISDLSVIPRGTFCIPEVGSVGLTEAEARQKGYAVGIGKVSYASFGKALVSREMEGLVKIVVDKKTKAVLGGHIVGDDAAEIIHEIALAMYAKIPYTSIAEMIHAYPTYAEAIGAAAYSAGQDI